MNFVIRVYVRVKFRWLFDFGKVEKQFAINGTTAGQFSYSEEPVNVPEDARKLLNQRGVVLKVW